MADDNDKGINNDNVVRGPWKRVKTVNQAKTNKITEDMGFSDEVAESVMIPMIHGLLENGVDIKTDEFVQEVGFLNEIIKSMMYRHLGYTHPMQVFIRALMLTKKENVEDVYATFNHDKLNQMTIALDKNLDKEPKDD